MGEKSAHIPLRVGFVSVCLRASRRAVPREKPRLQGDVRPGGVGELLQSVYLQVCFSTFVWLSQLVPAMLCNITRPFYTLAIAKSFWIICSVCMYNLNLSWHDPLHLPRVKIFWKSFKWFYILIIINQYINNYGYLNSLFMTVFVLPVSTFFFVRWGRGFGLVQFFVAKDSLLNQPNSVLGLMFYTVQMGLG